MSKDNGASTSSTGPAPSGLSRDASQAEPLVPSADEESYRLNPHFRRFMEIVQPVGLAAAAWAIAREAYFPSDPDGETHYEIWQGGDVVAECTGPRRRAIVEAVRYAITYQAEDDPCIIQEVIRREISPDEAEALQASGIETQSAKTAGLGPQDESPSDAQNTGEHHV